MLKRKKAGSDGPKKEKEVLWQERNSELVALINERKIDGAMERAQELVEFVDKKFRGDTKEKATTYNNMGMVFFLARDFDMAEECFHDALNMRRRLFGDVHNEVAVILLNLAELYRTQAQEIFRANPVKAD